MNEREANCNKEINEIVEILSQYYTGPLKKDEKKKKDELLLIGAKN